MVVMVTRDDGDDEFSDFLEVSEDKPEDVLFLVTFTATFMPLLQLFASTK